MISDLHLLTDRQLIKLCLSDSREALEEFYRRYHAEIVQSVTAAFMRRRRFWEYPVDFQPPINDLVQNIYILLLDNNRRILRQLSGYSNKQILPSLKKLTAEFVRDSFRRFGKHDAARSLTRFGKAA